MNKKINIYKEIFEGEGTCDFCGERKKGFLSNAIKVDFRHLELKDNLELEWMKKSIFSFSDMYWATKDKDWEVKNETKYIRTLICNDCVKQLNK